MSEYQYYEFRALDRPLTREQMSELRKVSSRGAISSTSYTNEYQWGDFKGDPDAWMDRYFDAFLYYANWGRKILKFKIPKSLLSADAVSPYETDDSLWARTNLESTIVSFNLDPYDSSGAWDDYDGIMGSLVGLRSELAHSDHRCLYLGWLINRGIDDDTDVDDDEDRRELEPPVPAGLQDLSAAQQAFVDFFEIDLDLLCAAAAASPAITQTELSIVDLQNWIANVDISKKDEYLLRVLNGDGVDVGLELKGKLLAEMSNAEVRPEEPRRTVGQLQNLTKTIRDARVLREREQREANTKCRLDALLKRLPSVWAEIEAHADNKKVNHYDLAIALLVEIHELAKRGDVPNFSQELADFRSRHPTKRALLDRMDKVGLTD